MNDAFKFIYGATQGPIGRDGGAPSPGWSGVIGAPFIRSHS